MIPTNNIQQFLNLLENSYKLTWITKFIYFTLLFDLIYFFVKGVGIHSIKLNEQLHSSVGDLVGIVILLGIFSSLLLFILYPIFSSILVGIEILLSPLWSKLFGLLGIHDSNETHPNYREPNHVSMYELMYDAINEGDPISYKIYLKEKSLQEKSKKEQYINKAYTLGIFLIFIIEWHLSIKHQSSHLVIEWLSNFISNLGLTDNTKSSNYITISFILLIYAITSCWPKYPISKKIYYPRLANKLDMEKQKNNSTALFRSK